MFLEDQEIPGGAAARVILANPDDAAGFAYNIDQGGFKPARVQIIDPA